MRHLRICFFLSFVSCVCSYAGGNDPGAELKKGQPKPVASLVDRIISCNHWLGEPPYDADRAKEISNAVSELRCKHLEADESAVLSAYGAKPNVKKAIDAAKQVFL